jgi:hypothetical protein
MRTFALAFPLLAACSSASVVVTRERPVAGGGRIHLHSEVPSDIRVSRGGVPLFDDALSGSAMLHALPPGRYHVAVNGRQVRRKEFKLDLGAGGVAVVSVVRGDGDSLLAEIACAILHGLSRAIGWIIGESLAADDDDDPPRKHSSGPAAKSASPAKPASAVKW